MAKKPDGKAAGVERVAFTRSSAERIKDAVLEVERGDRDCGPLTFGNRAGGVSSKLFRVCTFTGAWSIGDSRTVAFKYQTATPNTVSVMNLFCGLNPGAVACDVSIAKDGTAWYLVQPNLTQQPGYSASGTQVLTVVNGSLKSIGTTACS
jgi:hypothetical protein